MKSLLAISFILCIIYGSCSAQVDIATRSSYVSLMEATRQPGAAGKTALPFPASYQRIPEFPGGFDDMVFFIQREIRYPAAALTAGKEGIVNVCLTLDASGVIKTATVVAPLGFGLEEEALRIVRAMPPWAPAQQGNHNVPAKITIPIQFSLR